MIYQSLIVSSFTLSSALLLPHAPPRSAPVSMAIEQDPLINGLALAATAGVFAYQQYALGGPRVASTGPSMGLPNGFMWDTSDDDECSLLPDDTEGYHHSICSSPPAEGEGCVLDEDFTEYYETPIWRCDE